MAIARRKHSAKQSIADTLARSIDEMMTMEKQSVLGWIVSVRAMEKQSRSCKRDLVLFDVSQRAVFHSLMLCNAMHMHV